MSRKPLLDALLAAGCAAFMACGAGAQTRPEARATPAAGPDRPNLIVVLLDDADVDITESIPRLRSLLIERGARCTSHVANTPLCGPSRTILLAGQYAHNTKVYYNNGPGLVGPLPCLLLRRQPHRAHRRQVGERRAVAYQFDDSHGQLLAADAFGWKMPARP